MKSKRFLIIVVFLMSGNIAFTQARFDLLDHWAYGIQNQIYLDGSIGYINSGATLVIADFSDTLHPIKLNEIRVDRLVDAFIVAEKHLYIGDRYQLWVFDAASSVYPALIAKMDIPEPVQRWYYHEGRLYQIGNKKIHIYSLTDPASPVLIQSVPTGESIWDMVFYDSLILATSRYYQSNQVVSVNLQDPENPVVRQIPVPESNYLNTIGIYHDQLIAGGSGNIYRLTFNDSGNISADTIIRSGFVYHFFPRKDMLFVSRQGYGIDCYEMKELMDPHYAGTISTWAEKIVFYGPYLFVSSDYYGDIRMHDISDLLNPVYDITRIVFGGFNFDMELTSQTAFISQNDRIAILDITDPGRLTEISSLLTEESQDLELHDDLLFIAEGDLGWSIADVSDPYSPVILRNMPADGYVNQLLVLDNYLYIAAGKEGVQIFDISDPYAPVETGRYSNDHYFERIYPVGSYLYVYEDGSGIRVLDISDRSQPQSIDLVPISGGVRTMLAYQNSLYVGINGDSRMLDISDPAHPIDLGLVFFWQNPLDLFIADEILYVTELSRGLYLYDVSDARSPVFIDRYDSPVAASGIQVQNDVIYLLDQLNGLSTLQYGSTTGITDIAGSNSIFIFPNPVQDEVQIIIPSSAEASRVFIRDLSGKIWLQRNVTGKVNTITMNISQFIPGMYFVTHENREGNQTEKFIKY